VLGDQKYTPDFRWYVANNGVKSLQHRTLVVRENEVGKYIDEVWRIVPTVKEDWPKRNGKGDDEC